MKKNNLKKYALLSVYDKTGIVALAQSIVKSGYHIISTGGTAKVLTDAHIPVIPIQIITGNPESFDGRMKTISFQIEGGILFDRSKKKHCREAKKLHVPDIQMVVCNLYPFRATIQKHGVTLEEAVEQIDVGGPTMIRSAAKNFNSVLVVVDPKDYETIANNLKKGFFTKLYRKALAAKAFRHLSFYDSQIAQYLGEDMFSNELTVPLESVQTLRYGDNPDQKASIFTIPHETSPFRHLQKITGRDLSATNVTDIDAGLKVVGLFDEPTVAVIKHNTPCGIASGTTIHVALERALKADSESAFGGVVVLNTPMTFKAAHMIASFKEAGKGQMDIIAAPAFEEKAIALLSSVRKTTGLYAFGSMTNVNQHGYLIKHIIGGVVIQTANDPCSSFSEWTVVTKKKPTKKQLQQMQYAWKCIARIKSNTIIVVDKDIPMTRGIGCGQTSRVLATKIALERAGSFTKQGILASDSFFPFDDSVNFASKAGIGAIVQQGGSIRDADSIRAADKLGIAMVFTHQRLFWH